MADKLNITNNKKVSKKLVLDKKADKKLNRFNTEEALRKASGDDISFQIVMHPATRKVGAGAKNSGKTWLVMIKQLYMMETQVFSSCLGLRKYSTSAANRLGAALLKAYVHLKMMGFYFPYEYEQSQQFLRRIKNKKSKRINQHIEFCSFEDENGIAGIDVPNGGYISIAHIEEPILKDDVGNIPDRAEWEESLSMIADSCNRLAKVYNNYAPEYPAKPTEWWFTFNEWDSGHPLSEDLEYFIPLMQWYTFILGFDHTILNWDSPNEESTILQNRAILDPIWEDVKKSLKENHTKSVYVDKDTRFGKVKTIDTLYFRRSKFANPVFREDEYECEKIYEDAYNAIISGDSFELARVLGGRYDGADSSEKTHQFINLDEDVDCEQEIIEKDLVPDAISMGWDIDVNRNLVLTPAIFAWEKVLNENWNPYFSQNEPEYFVDNPTIYIMPQITIPAYGKGVAGSNNDTYARQVEHYTMTIMNDYIRKFPTINLRFCRVDQITLGVLEYLRDYHYDEFDILAETRRNGDWAILYRQDVWQYGIDSLDIKIDKRNDKLIYTLKNQPKDIRSGKRIEKGRWEALMDYLNSGEAAIYDFKHKFNWTKTH